MGPAESRAWWAALLAAWLLLCVPLLLVDVPPLGDYPNHLARMVVLAHLADVPAFADIFSAHWAIIPDLAADGVMPWLVSVLPVHVAGRLLLALILGLELAGAAACAAALHGRRTWWSLAAALVAYHYAFIQGFLNFDLTLAASMPLAALWIRLRPAHPAPAATLAAAASALLFFGHLMGLVFFLLLVGSSEAARLLPRLRERPFRPLHALARTAPALAALVPPAILYPLTGLHGAGGDTAWLPWRERLVEAMAGLVNYVWPLDLATAAAILLFLAACAATRRLRLAPGALLALLLAAGLFPVMPNDLKGTSLVALRLAIMLAFLVAIAVRPTPTRRLALAAGAAFATLFIVRMAVVSVAWWGYRTDVANLRALIAPIAPGDRLTQIDISRFDVPDYARDAPLAWRMSDGLWTEPHLPALAVIERHAFWTNMFVNPDQQPLVFNSPWQALAQSGLDLPDYAALVQRRAQHSPPAANPFCAFDWILLQGAWAEPHPETLSPDWLDLVAANRTAALYHVHGARSCTLTHKP